MTDAATAGRGQPLWPEVLDCLSKRVGNRMSVSMAGAGRAPPIHLATAGPLKRSPPIAQSHVIGGVIFLLFVWLPIANIAISFAVMCLYGALTESSEHQASLGKRAMGLKVTDLEGKRISFGQALGRSFLKEFFSISVLGWLTFLAILFTKKKQGVHDLMASTLVWKTS